MCVILNHPICVNLGDASVEWQKSIFLSSMSETIFASPIDRDTCQCTLTILFRLYQWDRFIILKFEVRLNRRHPICLQLLVQSNNTKNTLNNTNVDAFLTLVLYGGELNTHNQILIHWIVKDEHKIITHWIPIADGQDSYTRT